MDLSCGRTVLEIQPPAMGAISNRCGSSDCGN